VLASGDMRRAGKLTRCSALCHDSSHGDLEMPALIAGNRANVSAIDENGNGRLAGTTDPIRARDVPPFDLISYLGQPVAHGSMVMGPCHRHKNIKHARCFTE